MRQSETHSFWLGLYATALTLAGISSWLWPAPALVLATGLALLAAEGAFWWRAMWRGAPIDLSMPFRALTVAMMWAGPALAEVVKSASWFNGDVLQLPWARYAALALPGTALLNLALHWRWPPGEATAAPRPGEARRLAWLLVCAGISCALFRSAAPDYLRQPLHLGAQLVYPGLLFAMLAWPERRWQLAGAGALLALAGAVWTTFFSDALFWSLLLGWQAIAGTKIRRCWRWAAPVVAGLALFILLAFKYEFRRGVWEQGGNRREVLCALVTARVQEPERLADGETWSSIVNRFNQGFYTGQAMLHTPAQEPFADGQTLWRDLYGALLPRWLAPDKPQAGGHENMKRFAGRELDPNFSVNIGFFGEAYVNFGVVGAWVWLAVYGFAFVLLEAWVRRFGLPWAPFLLLPAIQVETDFGIAFNHCIKAGFIMLFILALNRFLNIIIEK